MDVTNSVKGVSFAAFLTRRIQEKKEKDFSSSSVEFLDAEKTSSRYGDHHLNKADVYNGRALD